MSQYDISHLSPAQVLASAYNNARVNGYVREDDGHLNTFSNASLRSDGYTPCPDEIREAQLEVETAQSILEEARARQGTDSPHIEAINGKWLYLRFEDGGRTLHAEHQIIGEDIVGAERYSADHGVDLSRVLGALESGEAAEL